MSVRRSVTFGGDADSRFAVQMISMFSENLRLALKMISMTSAQLAAELGTHKSVVSRWLNGSVQPTPHNISRLTALVQTQVKEFRILDWERDPVAFAELFGVTPGTLKYKAPGLPIAIWDQMVATSALRGKAYQGFFRSTRPSPTHPGRFVHDHGMIRRDENGLMRLTMGSAGTVVEGWMIPLHNQLYCIAADVTGGTLLFGIFNGLGGSQVNAFDGLCLITGSDLGRAPTATPMFCERVGVLTGDRAVDDARWAELAAQNPIAPEGSVPEHIRKHLVRDIGPTPFGLGGDLLLALPLARSLSRGPDFDAHPKTERG